MKRIVLLAPLLSVMASFIVSVHAEDFPRWDEIRIEILWPHNDLPVAEAERANMLIYIMRHDGDKVTPICNTQAEAPVPLVALNSGVVEPIQTGKFLRVQRIAKDGRPFPAWEYQDIDVSAARDADTRLVFTSPRQYIIPALGKTLFPPASPNFWAHAQNALTYLPRPDVPVGIDPDLVKGANVDAKIQIVWPHGGVPVTEADKVNITVALFRQDTLYSVPPDFNTNVALWMAMNNEAMKAVGFGQKRLVDAGNFVYPVWDFNNIDVSAARDPQNKYFFMPEAFSLAGKDPPQVPVRGTPNIWVHGADGRTYFPEVDVPDEGCP